MALKDNLVAVWELNESSGTRVDSFSTNDLTDGSSVGSTAGLFSQNAAVFASASTDYLTIADNAALSLGNEDFSISAWIRITADNGSARMLAKYHYDSDNREYAIAWDAAADNTFSFQIGFSSGTAFTEVYASTFGAPATNGTQWCWLYMYHENGTEIGISVDNGTIDTSAHTGGVHSGSSSLNIGRRQEDLYCDADIQQVAIWRRLLTADDRAVIYNSGSGLSYSSWDASSLLLLDEPMLTGGFQNLGVR